MLKNLERKQLQKQREASPITKLGASESSSEEQAIRQSFKRFQRLSTIMSKVPSFKGMEKRFSSLTEGSEDEQNEFFEVIESNEDEKKYKIKMFQMFERYIEKYECVDGKGLLIKELNISNCGRALLLEFGVQGNTKWFVEEINGKNVQKYTKEHVNNLLDSITVDDDGYCVVLRKR